MCKKTKGSRATKRMAHQRVERARIYSVGERYCVSVLCVYLKFIMGFNNDAHQWSVHMRSPMLYNIRIHIFYGHEIDEPATCALVCQTIMMTMMSQCYMFRRFCWQCQNWNWIWRATSNIFTSIPFHSVPDLPAIKPWIKKTSIEKYLLADIHDNTCYCVLFRHSPIALYSKQEARQKRRTFHIQ